MKKKWVALLLVLAMAVSLSTAAFAADTGTSGGTLVLSSETLYLKVGETAVLTATDSGSSVSQASWASGNSAVASVADGTVTAYSLGRTTVTVTAQDGRSASCDVHVVLKGIDVSEHQGLVDWSSVKAAGVDFAILRTGYGNEMPETQTDDCFEDNYMAATANGIKVGVYHVSYATTPEIAVQEAQMCLTILNGRHLDYPVFYDIESNIEGDADHASLTNDQLAAIVNAFCGTITASGYKTGIYSNTSMFNSKLSSPSLSGYDKWVAHYYVPSPGYSGNYTMWQYSDAGLVGGINTASDMDYCYTDYLSSAAAAAPVQTPADSTILSDTGFSLSVKPGQSYQFKFTPNGITGKPSFTTGNSGVAKIVYQKLQNGSYYVKILGVGAGTTSIYSVLPNQSPVRRCVVTVA
ncbi:GH25 family lysozyme [Caproiciproducens faecalis]|uniref:Ig-like domain-containing protein n=1 Tax=Caproiciproducens faecalis TaxID=2820301 RepID=A0ABS7DP48_9FIRM|nr:GH25 family lysozyme [Caproiciproducens faecalis]MBW7572894.1 Ig-like domain-containing protein [Caproiciproducens faecalis]